LGDEPMRIWWRGFKVRKNYPTFQKATLGNSTWYFIGPITIYRRKK
jgi:hypothetical protein